MRHLSTKPKEIAYPIQKQAPGPGIHIRREESGDYFEFKRLLELCVNKFRASPLGPSLPLIPSIYVRTQDTSSKHSMAPKNNQVVMIEKNVINSTTTGQSSTGGKIVNTTPSNGSDSVSSTKINLNSTPFVTLPAMQFDGKGNPKQHIAHFIKTCNNAGTDGDHLVKQFVQSLKGNAFDWYVDLEPESIDSCDKMEREFLNRFYSTRRTVSMIANAKACIGDSSTFCKRSSLENFEDLSTRAHDIQLIITNHKTAFLIDNQTKDKKDLKRSEKYTKTNVKESMTIKTTSVKISSNDRKRLEKPENQRTTNDRPRLTLKELQEKEYLFPESDEKIMVMAKEGKIILDIEEMAGTNVASIITENNSMQEILPSKISIDQSLEQVHPRATPIENNDEILSKATKNEALTSGKHEISKPPYSPVFQNVGREQLNEARVKDLREIKTELVKPITSLHPLISSDSPIPENQHRNMQGAFSQKAHHLLAKSRYDFSAPSRLNKLNPELTGEKIHGLTKAQHKLRNQDFCVVQPRIGLGFITDEPLKIPTRQEVKCATTQYISMENGKTGENQRPNDNRVSVFNWLGTPPTCTLVFERLGEASEDSSNNIR
ncbi:hypothetical protein Sango_0014200 [Sesamum angolense]|uniref:Retrotransposon gag domain-containing protein n=1 Tax=Sesamum angolense TaxID=2727404 RepID=A0AAE2C522_9LAMI|nr:hypothetical protein Sango_0014200 [Sesamum angolense]